MRTVQGLSLFERCSVCQEKGRAKKKERKVPCCLVSEPSCQVSATGQNVVCWRILQTRNAYSVLPSEVEDRVQPHVNIGMFCWECREVQRRTLAQPQGLGSNSSLPPIHSVEMPAAITCSCCMRVSQQSKHMLCRISNNDAHTLSLQAWQE